MGWLADRLGIHLNLGGFSKKLEHVGQQAGHALGSTLDNPWTKTALATALAGSGLGLPAAAALMGAEGFAGGILKPGGKIGDALKTGAIQGGATYAGGKALGALRGKFAPGSGVGATLPGEEVGSAVPSAASAVPNEFSSGLDQAASGLRARAGMGAISGPGAAYGAIAGGVGAGGSGGLAGALKAAGSFARDNPTAMGMGLQGLGGLATAGSQNALVRAQAEQLAAQTRALEEEQEEKKRRGLAMDPLLRALMGNMARPVAPNPYA